MSTGNQTGTAVAVASHQSSGAIAPLGVFSSIAAFESAQRMAKALASSSMVPESYRGDAGMGNALVALDLADRVGASPLMVMQNLDVIQGRPSWRSQFIISALNSSGRFSPLRWEITDLGDKEVSYEYWDGPKGQRTKKTGKMTVRNIRWICWAYDKATGEKLTGPEVTTVMAVEQGWWTKSDSKWPSMTDLMGRYRSAAFFGRLYAPEVLMGMHTDDEVRDMVDVTPATPAAVPQPSAGVETGKPDADTGDARHVAGEVLPPTGKPAGRGGGRKKPADAAAGQQGSDAVVDVKPEPDNAADNQAAASQSATPPFDMDAGAGQQGSNSLPQPTGGAGADIDFPD